MASTSLCKGAAFVAQLKACAERKDLYTGSKIHAEIVESRLLDCNVFLGSTLIYMYGKCGALTKARHVFDELPARNVFSWTALISAYAHRGSNEAALACFRQMKCEGLFPDAITFACILKACGGLRSLHKGRIIHADIVREGLLGTHTTLGNALLDMYAKCGVLIRALIRARQLFDEFVNRDAISWNSLITGYCEHGDHKKALDCFEEMKLKGVSPNPVTFLCALKACGNIKAIEKGRKIHDEIDSKGLLPNNSTLCSALIEMYANCGLLAKAKGLFHGLPVRDLVLWNTLITGHCKNDQGEEVLKCYERMKHEKIFPNAITLACVLKACGNIRAISKGEQVHEEICQKGLLMEDNVLATSLVDMYAKCGMLKKAQKVFDQILSPDVVSWNALIAGYCHHACGEEAFANFERMKRKGFAPNMVTFSSLLQVCGSMGATEKGRELHAEIVRNGLRGKVSDLGSSLVDMYAKCGALTKAQEVFDKLSVQDVVSWTALISGYCGIGNGKEALTCFESMLKNGPSPDAITFACALDACKSLGAAEKGQCYLDLMVTRYGVIPTLEHYVYMVDLLGGVGYFNQATALINKMKLSECFEVWYALLGACLEWVNIKLGQLAFDNAHRLNPNSAAVYVCMSRLYAAGGMQEDADKMLVKAKEVFDSIPIRDAVSWNALIAGYCDQGHGQEAITCFDRLKKEGTSPNALTYLSVLKACGNMGLTYKGKEIHDEIAGKGLLERDSILGTALVDMYCKCGAIVKAKEVFDKLKDRNEIAWNALIAWYCEHGFDEEALQCFDLMQYEGLLPDPMTVTWILNVCGNLGLPIRGQEIHEKIVHLRLLGEDDVIGSALVNMYSKCGEVVKAQEVFDKLAVRDVMSWNALIAGRCYHGHEEKACNSYEQMKQEGVSPNENTYASVLKACGTISAIEKGVEIHAEICRGGLLKDFSVLGSALIDMYAKCSFLLKAQEVLDTLRIRDVFSWTALIAGYSQHGLCEESFDCFKQMTIEGGSPDAVTFACVLKVCSCMGAIEKGQRYYEYMSASYGISPSIEHHGYVAKLLAYAGQFDRVMTLIEKIPWFETSPVWFSLLGTCQKTGSVKYGHLAFKCTA